MDNFIVSARKYRPSTFDAVVGQKALTITLKNAVLTGKLAHAYLFCGPRGVGKTTCARIFAKSINCEHLTPEGEVCDVCESCRAFNEQRSYNIHELDAASNNSVDDIRELIDQVRIPPQIGRYKVFIIDEVHMLSPSAFNAFLKTLEEPPRHAIFILATTERHKVLPTILSRCQIYDFTRIEIADIVEHLAKVAVNEGVSTEEAALHIIAQKADGGMRDALSLFDQMVSYTQGNVTYQGVIASLNILDYEYYFRFTDLFLEHKVGEAMLLFDEVLRRGFDGGNLITNLAAHLRDLLVSCEPATLPLLEVSHDVRERYREQAGKCNEHFLINAIKLCNDCDLNYRVSKNKRLLVELTLIQLSQLTSDSDDGMGSGRSPKCLKPLFQKAVVSAAVSQSNNSRQAPSMSSRQIVSVPVSNKSTGAQNALELQPKTAFKRPSISIRSKGNVVLEDSALDKPSQNLECRDRTEVISSSEDISVSEDGMRVCWKHFASELPKENSAIAGRLLNLRPTLDEGFKVTVRVDNRMVESDILGMRDQIEEFMRKRLENNKLLLQVVVEEELAGHRIYSRVEQFQILEERNPALLKLKESLDLDLN